MMPQLDYSIQFNALTELLKLTQPLWQVVAFDCHDLPWQEDFPRLAERVWQIDDANLDAIDSDQTLLVGHLLSALQADLTGLGQSSQLPLLHWLTSGSDKAIFTKSNLNLSIATSELSHFSAHIKGRKWQQIVAFTEQVFSQPTIYPVLEWCAGKGHLGRLIAKTQQCQVTSLEWQQALCDDGQAFAQQWQLEQQFICADAFAAIDVTDSASPIKTKQHAVALHACGDLHVRLLDLAAKANTQAISISPCCYHLIHAKYYQPLSRLAQQAQLSLSRHDLQLPLQQSVIASKKQNALRIQEVAWRLGFDSLQRDIRKIDQYLPVPTLKQSQLSGSFSDFCHWAAKQKGLVIANHIDIESYLVIGKQRQRLTQRIDLVRHVFRSVLEQWLVLDRVCFLTEQNYHVTLSKFCPSSITPRNILIDAKKTI
ncbi:methyltransferase [Shewanella aestuarii]|uniref:Methyltransferase n=1 Tax=Shewanella aestuarii TaxID=1028752 RepID=A0A6G9QHZ4_9GAMM|nr:methyltransferase [Shewanella aestuarii]QIR14116.1 methyltransferase [Shewanella aestuarii]